MVEQKYKCPKIDSHQLCFRWCIEIAQIACLSGSSIFLALSKFFIVPWQTELEFYGKNADNIITMILNVDFTL